MRWEFGQLSRFCQGEKPDGLISGERAVKASYLPSDNIINQISVLCSKINCKVHHPFPYHKDVPLPLGTPRYAGVISEVLMIFVKHSEVVSTTSSGNLDGAVMNPWLCPLACEKSLDEQVSESSRLERWDAD